MKQFKLPLPNAPFAEAAARILDEQVVTEKPNLTMCVIALGYSVLALLTYLEDNFDCFLNDILICLKKSNSPY